MLYARKIDYEFMHRNKKGTTPPKFNRIDLGNTRQYGGVLRVVNNRTNTQLGSNI